MSEIKPNLEPGWYSALKEEFQKKYFLMLKEFLIEEKKKYAIFPPGALIFNAFNTTPFNEVKVVIIGQDPYHGKGQAHGLSFSVPDSVALPPSLKNIFAELNSDTGTSVPQSGNLSHWAKQGVLLLNAVLTVRENQAASHQGKGWENFTDAVVSKLNDEKEKIVFILWGRYAQEKGSLINRSRHLVLTAAHPSPFSAYHGFFGCRHFSKTNEYLKGNGVEEIIW
ncbi:MAG: uracil-DNA glycosylase [Bacteroidetes bacterium RIFCSPLOWO2_02_FULL_36_8]|nr:MAG: uracil-DNA glycosylase [Bacteroidetes bacterium RIFCSPLOWO2_02_FULL_36_8]OFY69266.1 MAG: uracil-DNA glycosylase [Bacteroidetes bacterium RIFCSPLOWO2_12_FULL_37_12]